MSQPNRTHRRADHGTLIVRASALAAGIAASVGLQMCEPAAPRGPVGRSASALSLLCVEANGPFAFL